MDPIGLLYDPTVDEEVDLCIDWFNSMYDDVPMLRVRRNYLRRGTADNITTAMRAAVLHKLPWHRSQAESSLGRTSRRDS